MNYFKQNIACRQQTRAGRILYISVAAILCFPVISGILFFIWDIDLTAYISRVPLCPFHAVTGLPCPGCGMSRAFLLLGQLKFMEALAMNPFSIPLILLMIIYVALGRIPGLLQNKYLEYIFLFTILAFWVIRLLSFHEASGMQISLQMYGYFL